ncbi:hypothetical protein DL93DRAFT_261067 [Clavulina sp. PMI_390]|nr:hypothetical protein DL93DRAFT_261067 [Clavulina sp. PMI_390]
MVIMADNKDSQPFLDTTSGEVAVFKAVAKARPAGAHRYFHLMAMRSLVFQESGKEVPIDDLTRKIGQYWNQAYFDDNEVDPDDVAEGTMDPDVAAPSLESSSSSKSASPPAETESETESHGPPRKKQRRDPSSSKDAEDEEIKQESDAATDDEDTKPLHNKLKRNGGSTAGEKFINYYIHPHFRVEFSLPHDFEPQMLERAKREDGPASPRGVSPSPATPIASRGGRKSTAGGGRGGRKSQAQQQQHQQQAKAEVESSSIDESKDDYGDVEMAESSLSPARSPKASALTATAKAAARKRSRTRSISGVAVASMSKGKTPLVSRLADSDSSLSEPEDGGDDDDSEEEDEEDGDEDGGEDSLASGATPAAEHTEDEAPSTTGMIPLMPPFCVSRRVPSFAEYSPQPLTPTYPLFHRLI